MRHLRSVIYALVLAPTVWTLCAVGLTPEHTGRGRGDEVTVEAIGGLALLVLAGAAYALLLLPRFAPTGPLLAGLVFLGAATWALLDPAAYDSVWPADITRSGFDLRLPGRALAAFLAVPLLATALIPRRWRRHDQPVQIAVPPPVSYPNLATEATQVMRTGQPGDATQVLRPALAADVTHVLRPALAAGATPPRSDAEATQSIATQPPPGEATVRLPATSMPARSGTGPAAPDGNQEQTRRLTLPGGVLQLPEPPVMPPGPGDATNREVSDEPAAGGGAGAEGETGDLGGPNAPGEPEAAGTVADPEDTTVLPGGSGIPRQDDDAEEVTVPPGGSGIPRQDDDAEEVTTVLGRPRAETTVPGGPPADSAEDDEQTRRL